MPLFGLPLKISLIQLLSLTSKGCTDFKNFWMERIGEF